MYYFLHAPRKSYSVLQDLRFPVLYDLRGRSALFRQQEGAKVSNAHVWWQAQQHLKREMSAAQFDTWLRGTHLRRAPDGATALYVRSTFDKESLESRFSELIAASIAGVTGQPCSLRILVAGADSADEELALPAVARNAHASGQGQTASGYSRRSGHRADAVARPTLFESPPETLPQTRQPGELTGRSRERWQTDELPPTVREMPRGTAANGGVWSMRRRMRSAFQRARQSRGRTAPSGGGSRPATGGLTATRREEEHHGHAYMLQTTGVEYRPMTERSAFASTDGMAQMERFDDTTDVARPAEAQATQDVSAEVSAPTVEADEIEAFEPPIGELPVEAPGPVFVIAPPRLNSRYTFSTFIVGNSNQLAYAASQAVAEAPGHSYNPLFLYGGVGLGKTHLLHAVGHTAIERNLTVLYVSSETFTNEIVNAIRYRNTENFRAKYRSVDLLLVDDIQFIAGKDSTEEEFFHTFNSLYETNKQIVMCSDRPPNAITSLAERLRSRFQWGLIADIQAPDLETRAAILQAKAGELRLDVPNDVINYLAGRVHSNIRELEGSFNRLLAFADLQHMPLTLETAKAAISGEMVEAVRKQVSVEEVLGAVADFYGIPVGDLLGKQRDKHIVVPRQVAMYLMRNETDASLLEIGQTLGGRDHSTVLHGCEKISREVKEHGPMSKDVLAIRQQLLS